MNRTGYGIVRTVIVIARYAAGAGVVAHGVPIAHLGARGRESLVRLGRLRRAGRRGKDGFLHDGVSLVGMFYRPSETGCLVENRLRTVWARNRQIIQNAGCRCALIDARAVSDGFEK